MTFTVLFLKFSFLSTQLTQIQTQIIKTHQRKELIKSVRSLTNFQFAESCPPDRGRLCDDPPAPLCLHPAHRGQAQDHEHQPRVAAHVKRCHRRLRSNARGRRCRRRRRRQHAGARDDGELAAEGGLEESELPAQHVQQHDKLVHAAKHYW
jgi:hypothetical protein